MFASRGESNFVFLKILCVCLALCIKNVQIFAYSTSKLYCAINVFIFYVIITHYFARNCFYTRNNLTPLSVSVVHKSHKLNFLTV